MTELAVALDLQPELLVFRTFLNASDPSAPVSRRSADNGVIIKFSILDNARNYVEGDRLQDFKEKLAVSSIAQTTMYQETQKLTIDPRSGGPAVILFLAAVSVAASIFLICNILLNRNHKHVRKLAPLFSAQIVFGILLAFVLPFLYTWQPTSGTCTAQIWIGGIGFAIAFGNTIAKNYRLFRIFNNRGKLVLTDKMIIPIPVGIVLIEIIIDAAYTRIGQPAPTLVDSDGLRYWTCASSETNSFVLAGVATGYKLILVMTALLLSYLTRHAYGGYAESKPLALSCYVTLASGIVVLPTAFVGDISPVTVFYLKSFGILVTGWTFLMTFFILRSPILRSLLMQEKSTQYSTLHGKPSGSQNSKPSAISKTATLTDSNVGESPKKHPAREGILGPFRCYLQVGNAYEERWEYRSLTVDQHLGILILVPESKSVVTYMPCMSSSRLGST
ncbi:7 transmembrane sweet-taste receptor of 3 GCPR-domain-containing protein [Phlyctochytrium arcticum]|nr:7 transmembrane sweet-taste receptor of 3 GCPR-domain-containing protein [Phlyctochytrium arcticum]